jgi:hypothetical protein
MDAQKKFTVQLITEEGLWPYVGTAYMNKNASLNLYLDAGVSLMGGQKLHLRPARPQNTPVSRPSRPA